MAIEVGSTVRLKSGGPLMTVSSVEEDGRVFCAWFNNTDGKSEAEFTDFNIRMLVEDDGCPPMPVIR